MSKAAVSLTGEQIKLLSILKERFEEHPDRHQGLSWQDIQARLEASPEKLRSLEEMEKTGGEPDVIGQDKTTGAYLYCDCSSESPAGRRKISYDREGQTMADKRGSHPAGNAVDMAAAMGIELLDEDTYSKLQQLGEFDAKTSSWIKTPAEIRQLGGALFMDRRFNAVFVYHNGAYSWYGARGFRGILKI